MPKQKTRPINQKQCETALPPGDGIEAKGRKQSRSRGVGIRRWLIPGTHRESPSFVFEKRRAAFPSFCLHSVLTVFHQVGNVADVFFCFISLWSTFVVWRINCKPNIIVFALSWRIRGVVCRFFVNIQNRSAYQGRYNEIPNISSFVEIPETWFGHDA